MSENTTARPLRRVVMHALKLLGAMLFLAVAVSACGRSQSNGANSSSSNTANPNAPTPAEQQVIFSYAQFASQIAMHIPADEFASSQIIAAQQGPWEWWTFIRSNVGCAQEGYAVTLTSHAVPTVDGYSFDGNQLESTLEQAGLRVVQSYTTTLNPTPWGSISRTFNCLINTGKMAPFAQGQNLHGDLTIPLGQRVCSRWTFVNHYQSPTPGQGNVQVFAGTFAYSMKSLVVGAVFSGEGTASVKMYLNPDNGQWTVTNFELHDPQLSFSGFSDVVQPDPAQTTCIGP